MPFNSITSLKQLIQIRKILSTTMNPEDKEQIRGEFKKMERTGALKMIVDSDNPFLLIDPDQSQSKTDLLMERVQRAIANKEEELKNEALESLSSFLSCAEGEEDDAASPDETAEDKGFTGDEDEYVMAAGAAYMNIPPADQKYKGKNKTKAKEEKSVKVHRLNLTAIEDPVIARQALINFLICMETMPINWGNDEHLVEFIHMSNGLIRTDFINPLDPGEPIKSCIDTLKYGRNKEENTKNAEQSPERKTNYENAMKM